MCLYTHTVNKVDLNLNSTLIQVIISYYYLVLTTAKGDITNTLGVISPRANQSYRSYGAFLQVLRIASAAALLSIITTAVVN